MTLIRGGRLIDPASGTDRKLDVLLEEGRIVEIGQGLSGEGRAVIEAEGLIVAPGLIDTHVHFREPGQTEKEDIRSGAAAAARGGFTTVICMANTQPPIDSPERLLENLAKGRETGIRVLQAACITKGMQGKELTDFAALKEAGAVCLSDDGLPILDSAVALRAMRRAAGLGIPLSFHEEDSALIGAPGVNAGEISRALSHPGAGAVAEDALVARDCALALHSGAQITMQHVSSRGALEAVRLARALGAKIHAEGTPHHFTLTEEALLEWGTLAKMNPPLRTEADREALIEGLREGLVDIIATDHAPHTAFEKALPLAQAPSGIVGLETALALGITQLVRTGRLTLSELLERMTAGPASCYRLEGGCLQEGGVADLVLFDPDEAFTVGELVSRSGNSPFVGCRLFGRVHRTICAGRTVYRL